MQLNNEELLILKKPMGILLRNNQVSQESLSRYLRDRLVITVGDATTERLLELGIVPSIQIVDGRERRVEREPPLEKYAKVIRCRNPAGEISSDAIHAFREALRSEKPVRIIVDGEEDLLGAVVLALAAENSVMLYGQPLEGLVLVTINEESRSKLREVINRIRAYIS
jgi:hypothetical protein